MKNFKYEYLQKCISLYNILYYEVITSGLRYILKRDVFLYTNAAKCEILHDILKKSKYCETQNLYEHMFPLLWIQLSIF